MGEAVWVGSVAAAHNAGRRCATGCAAFENDAFTPEETVIGESEPAELVLTMRIDASVVEYEVWAM